MMICCCVTEDDDIVLSVDVALMWKLTLVKKIGIALMRR